MTATFRDILAVLATALLPVLSALAAWALWVVRAKAAAARRRYEAEARLADEETDRRRKRDAVLAVEELAAVEGLSSAEKRTRALDLMRRAGVRLPDHHDADLACALAGVGRAAKQAAAQAGTGPSGARLPDQIGRPE